MTLSDYLINRCSNDVERTFVRQELLIRKFFSWNFSFFVVSLQLTLKLTKKFSLFSFSVHTINFFRSANFYCDTFRLFDKSMQQWCRNNFCPARFAEEKVFLLKLFDLGCESSVHIEINEEIFLLDSCPTPHKFSLQGGTNYYMMRFCYEHSHLTLISCQDHSKRFVYWFISWSMWVLSIKG